MQQGANADVPASIHYYSYGCFHSALSIACVSSFSSDLSLFKPLLRATKILNHDFSGWYGTGSLIEIFITNYANSPDKNQRISLFFHEVALRSEQRFIDVFLKFSQSIEFDETSCQKYLNDIDLTTDQAIRAGKGLDYLVAISFLSKETSHKIKAMISAKTKFALEINEFPVELQKSLAKPTNRTLEELFAELQYLLLPNENLPPGLADGIVVMKTTDLTDSELKKICSFQDPKRLRQYMELDPSEFLTMLYDATSPQGENPAAILLSQILMFHKTVLLDDKKPLFNEAQVKNCFLILKRLYTLSDTEKLTLISHRKHGEDVRELRYENAVLQKQVEDSNAKIESLEAKVNQLVAMIRSMQAQPNQSDQQDKTGMKRAYSSTFKF